MVLQRRFSRPPEEGQQTPQQQEQPPEPIWDTPILDAVLGEDRVRLFDAEHPVISNETWQRSRRVSGTIFGINVVRMLLTGV